MQEDEIYVLIGVGALIMGFIGVYVSNSKNRSGWEGFLFGFFLSILGIIIAALLPTIKKEKPAELTAEEREEMELKAKVLQQKADKVNQKSTTVRNFVLFICLVMFLIALLSRL